MSERSGACPGARSTSSLLRSRELTQALPAEPFGRTSARPRSATAPRRGGIRLAGRLPSEARDPLRPTDTPCARRRRPRGRAAWRRSADRLGAMPSVFEPVWDAEQDKPPFRWRSLASRPPGWIGEARCVAVRGPARCVNLAAAYPPRQRGIARGACRPAHPALARHRARAQPRRGRGVPGGPDRCAPRRQPHQRKGAPARHQR